MRAITKIFLLLAMGVCISWSLHHHYVSAETAAKNSDMPTGEYLVKQKHRKDAQQGYRSFTERAEELFKNN